jgi:type II secretory ATPase GspE/PulE/Tfp pilus assembly ATPase PilB-like protein
MIELLGQILIEQKLIDAAMLEKALCLQKDFAASGGMMLIGEVLRRHFDLTEESLFRALAKQFSLPFIETIHDGADPEIIREIPPDIFKESRFYPLTRDSGVMSIIVDDPFDFDALTTIQALTSAVPEVSLTTPSELTRAKEVLFAGDSVLKQSMGKLSQEYEKQLQTDETTLSIEEMKKRTESEPVVKLASLIFNEAIKLKASDIHIEPVELGANIRYRIDGLLAQHMDITRSMYVPLTSRIKIMADLDIAEKRVPQDGRIRYDVGEEQFDFRVSTLPTHFGEKTVIRILKHDMELLALHRIGFTEKELESIGELIEKPQGMIFVTGPTGSGKSSTLFACLNAIRGKAINITTIEDPIEYKVAGINQVQINEKAGVTFASTLRSILRQDPDVILVGEIRDRETAEIAIQASQTGHLVFSTLHTNDAISAITRLKDLGIPGFLISSSLLAILAQRLVRLLCPRCKEKAPWSKEILERWRMVFSGSDLPDAFSARGCEECHHTGYKGRIGIFELAIISDVLRDLITENAAESKIRQYLRGAGMKTLLQNGIEKIDRGLTTPDELLRVVMVEDIVNMNRMDQGISL